MLAVDHLYGKLLFTWMPLVMSMMVSFCAVLFPRDVLDEILDLIESDSEVFIFILLIRKITYVFVMSFSSLID